MLLLLGTLVIFLTEIHNRGTLQDLSLQEQLLAAWFQSMTTRTAGFNSIDFGKMTIAGLFLTMGLMFIGASPSGTGGGIKTTTFRVLLNCTKSALEGKDDVVLYQREVPSTLILKAVAVVVGTGTCIVCFTTVISFIEPDLEFIQILFEVISAFATAGLSMGITAGLSTGAKLILVLAMYIGRVSILLVIAAIIGDARPTSLQYPQENLLVG